jgi:hypothetical protein
MLTITGKDIRNAAVHAGDFYLSYKSHIKPHLEPGFGIQFDTFGELGSFLVKLGGDSMYREMDWNHTRSDYVNPDDAGLLGAHLQIDPLGDGLIAYFPGWELSAS